MSGLYGIALDQNPAASAFIGPVLDEAIALAGPMRLELDATSAGTDADWVARAVDVGENEARVISEGWLRASHRRQDAGSEFLWHTHEAAESLTPGEPYRMTIEIWPSSYRIPAGHRLGVLVQAADTMKVTPAAATSSILVGGGRSRLVVPMRTEPGAPYTVPIA